MDKLDKALVLSAVVLTVIIILMVGQRLMAEAMVLAVEGCSTGSYEIDKTPDGKPICKAEPTGCVHGDSIPLDMCSKFDSVPAQTPAPVAEPQVQAWVGVGK